MLLLRLYPLCCIVPNFILNIRNVFYIMRVIAFMCCYSAFSPCYIEEVKAMRPQHAHLLQTFKYNIISRCIFLCIVAFILYWIRFICCTSCTTASLDFYSIEIVPKKSFIWWNGDFSSVAFYHNMIRYFKLWVLLLILFSNASIRWNK